MKKNNLLYILCFLQIFFLTLMNINNPSFAEEVEPEINSPNVVLIDGTSGQILYEKNSKEQCYPASITKLMTALLSIEALKPEDTLTFSYEAVFSIEYNSSHIGMQEGESITVDQALHGLLLMSANEVSNGLAEKVSGSMEAFATKMTTRAKELGALNTNFVNSNGLYEENHYTTPYDMALITKELLKYDYFMDIMNDFTYEIPATNKVNEIRYLSQQHKMLNPKKDASIFREDVIGGKTGYTDEAGHTLVTISKRENQVLIAVVMKAAGTDMYSDTSKLLDYGFETYKNVTMEPLDYRETLPVMKDNKNIGEAIVTLKAPLVVAIKKDFEKSAVTLKANITTPFTDTLKEGNTMGTASIYLGDTLLTQAEIVLEKITLAEYINSKNMPAKSKAKGKPILLIIFILIILGVSVGICHYQKKSQGHYSRYINKKRSH